ncbi:MAG TPA: hypothetical protein VFY80_05030 [Burkholderiales bacterium]|nr:hypothetical protein [Burkholderiales bacterium]
MKKGFVVGRCDRKSRQMVILKYIKSPIAGPFSLKAVVAKA